MSQVTRRLHSCSNSTSTKYDMNVPYYHCSAQAKYQKGQAIFRTIWESQLFCERGRKKRENENDLLTIDLITASV